MLQLERIFPEIINNCQNSSIGKLLPNALYVHLSALTNLTPLLQEYEAWARSLTEGKSVTEATLVKFNTNKPQISYLLYPNFDHNPHPSLNGSLIVNLESQTVNYRDYHNSDNPPILHRKETFVSPDYPLYAVFAHLTDCEAQLGLLDNARFIGTRQEWEKRLKQQYITIQDHCLCCPLDLNPSRSRPIQIERHKAALIRRDLSRPVKLVLEAGLFAPESTFFDYGCGYGSDCEIMREKGYLANGWDPHYQPNNPLIKSDIVNLGYIINVIENLKERREALIQAWELTNKVLIVSAQVLISDHNRGLIAYGDGIITNRNTFQKYYEQEELKFYIDQVLNVDAIPAGLGVYLVFRDLSQAEAFRASRFHSNARTPRISVKIRRFEDYQELLTPLINFVTDRGRLPVKGELSNETEVKAEFRSMRTAFNLVKQATNEVEWSAIVQKRQEDLLLYIALSKFGQRPSYRQLSKTIREDIKSLCGNYERACFMADIMLFSLGHIENIVEACEASAIGKKQRNSLLVHISALDSLDPLLRLYEGCASRTIGRLETANVIKFHTKQPKISYLFYPNFEQNPRPYLETSMQIDLRDLHVTYRDYDREDNPPILEDKKALMLPDE